MRNVEPRMAGAASGVLNTVRQVGTVIGTAAVGALLQNRLVASWTTVATQQAHNLPPSVRGQFVAGFRNAAKSGLQVGSGQSGVKVKLPPGSSPGLLHQIGVIAGDVFGHGFVDAMRWTAVMPVALMLLAAAGCFGIKGRTRTPTQAPAETAGTATPAQAA
jgi:hypothetical protein